MADPINIELEVDLGDNGGKCRFSTLEEVEQWMTTERESWAWLNTMPRQDGNLEQTRIAQNNHWNETLGLINRVRGHAEAHRPRIVQEIAAWFNSNYKQKKVLHSSCVRAKHVEDIRKQDPVLAAYVLAFYLQAHTHPSPISQRGAFLALAQEYGLRDTAASQSSQLADVQGKWDAFKAASEKAFSDFQSQFTSAQQAIESERTAQQEQWQKTMAEYKAGFEEHIKTARGELNAIAKTYDEKLALQASVRYWKAKAKSHGIQAAKYRNDTIWAGVGTGAALLVTACLILGCENIGTMKLADLQFWKIAVFLVVATVGVWMIRIFVRLLLSNIHLHTDAVERRTMLLTYLALMRKNQLPDQKERQLVLQALFRPTSTGIVKDDASPPFMAEWLKRATGE